MTPGLHLNNEFSQRTSQKKSQKKSEVSDRVEFETFNMFLLCYVMVCHDRYMCCVTLYYITLSLSCHDRNMCYVTLSYLFYVTLCYVMLRYVALSSLESAALSMPRYTERGHREYTQSRGIPDVDPR